MAVGHRIRDLTHTNDNLIYLVIRTGFGDKNRAQNARELVYSVLGTGFGVRM